MTDQRPGAATTAPEGAASGDPAWDQATAPQAPALSTADIADPGAGSDGRSVRHGDAPREPTPARPAQADAGTDGQAPLFDEPAAKELRTRWTDVQAGFVDDPRTAVQQADALVAEVMKRLADGFARERHGLEDQWSQGDSASTEDLRVALRRYRSFFDRLLAL